MFPVPWHNLDCSHPASDEHPSLCTLSSVRSALLALLVSQANERKAIDTLSIVSIRLTPGKVTEDKAPGAFLQENCTILYTTGTGPDQYQELCPNRSVQYGLFPASCFLQQKHSTLLIKTMAQGCAFPV